MRSLTLQSGPSRMNRRNNDSAQVTVTELQYEIYLPMVIR